MMYNEVRDMDREDAGRLMDLAIGRLLRIMSRPFQAGDVEEYYRCRQVVIECGEVLGIKPPPGIGTHHPGWNFGGPGTGCVE